MSVDLSEKLKNLRKEKGVSQEKLAQYLNVSFQAVSKWENGNTCPDISLLPDIARFFGITVDELLQVEKIDEKKLYQEYTQKAYDLFRNGHVADTIPIWQEAYHKMPNNVQVKEMLMSAYFDTDKTKYQREIIELGTELYNSDASVYYKGQAIDEIARTYAANGNDEMAEVWASRAYQMMHGQEFLYMQILNDGKELTDYFAFANYWYFNRLFYMTTRLCVCENLPGGTTYIQSVEKTVAQLYEVLYPNDDMSFEDLLHLYILHRCVAEDETVLEKDEAVIEKHLTRALECAERSMSVEEHRLTHPLLMNWCVSAAPSDNKQIVRMMKEELAWSCFDDYRIKDWFRAIEEKLTSFLE